MIQNGGEFFGKEGPLRNNNEITINHMTFYLTFMPSLMSCCAATSRAVSPSLMNPRAMQSLMLVSYDIYDSVNQMSGWEDMENKGVALGQMMDIQVVVIIISQHLSIISQSSLSPHIPSSSP